jgi:hypothetical protein
MSPLVIRSYWYLKRRQIGKDAFTMSEKELSRLEIMTKVHEKRLQIVQVSECLGLS